MYSSRPLLDLCTMVAAVILVAQSARGGGTWYVNRNDANCRDDEYGGSQTEPFCEIQSAINRARDDGDVVFVLPGTYMENIDFAGKAVAVLSTNGPYITTIDGNQSGPVVSCKSGEGYTTVLSGFTITNGWAGHTGGIAGHGMYNLQSNPTVKNCIFYHNPPAWQLAENSDGGGMGNLESSPHVENCTFIENYADSGAAIHNTTRSSPRLVDCTFLGNRTFTVGQSGGAIANWLESHPIAENCVFSGNEAGYRGGAVYSDDDSAPEFINCTFSGNIANEGGALYSYRGAAPKLFNCVLWGNRANGLPNQMVDDDALTKVNYSCIEGGWQGVGSANNIDSNPLLRDADGLDNIPGTEDDDLRLSPGSPCIDAGKNVYTDCSSADRDGNPRCVDDPVAPDCPQSPGSCGDPPIVDMGAYEFISPNMVPALPEWGPIILALLLLTAGKVCFRNRLAERGRSPLAAPRAA